VRFTEGVIEPAQPISRLRLGSGAGARMQVVERFSPSSPDTGEVFDLPSSAQQLSNIETALETRQSRREQLFEPPAKDVRDA
jgi:hypothetical protein